MFFSFFFNLCFAELPRFVALRSHKINMHVGPGKHYPVTWQYTCAKLPVEVIAEFEDWRLIKDHEGITGWIHRSLLSGKRFAIVLTKQIIYSRPGSIPIAYAYKGVIGQILRSQQDWCRLDFSCNGKRFKGWVKRKLLWGLYEKENF